MPSFQHSLEMTNGTKNRGKWHQGQEIGKYASHMPDIEAGWWPAGTNSNKYNYVSLLYYLLNFFEPSIVLRLSL